MKNVVGRYGPSFVDAMLVKTISLIKEAFRHLGGIKAALIPETKKLRYVNWYLAHGCDLDCYYCKVPKQKVAVMTSEQRRQALDRLSHLCVEDPMISIIGGEPTLRPEILVEAVHDASTAGFFVSLVTNGWGLTPILINQLGKAGLDYLAISVDCDDTAIKSDLTKAIKSLSLAKKLGIIPVVNTVITNKTINYKYKQFVQDIVDNDFLISPLVCSPRVPGGSFSNASYRSVPKRETLRDIVLWLAWLKLKTGRVAKSFSYLWTLFNSGSIEDGDTWLWHCSPQFRTKSNRGRGFITLDSDGFIGPCQEFPRLVNVLKTPHDALSLPTLDQQFSETTMKCPGCLYSCYIMEEGLHGPLALAEVSTAIKLINIQSIR